MVEIRKEVTKNEWSIIAPTRSDRPFDFGEEPGQKEKENVSDCPFCPGNESDTPSETYAIREDEKSGVSDWQVRVFPNKFPALDRDGTDTAIEGDIFESMGGFGYHEVVAETPKHNQSLDDLEVGEIALVLQTYAKRAMTFIKDPKVEYVSMFRNQGKKAGASLSHPHSQIMATTFVPNLLKREYAEASSFFNQKGECLHCRIMEEEKREGQRIILENDGFLVFSPFGSRFPYETHLYPKRHRHSFAQIDEDEITLMAGALKRTLRSMSANFGHLFPYNYSIHTGYSREFSNIDGFEESYHWHLEIIPRLTTPAGFEWGSGNYINIINPEDAAGKLRNKISQP